MSLFDASSIIETLQVFKEESIPILVKGLRLELTLYEVGNSIRRVYARRRPVKDDVAAKTRAAARVLGAMEIIPIVAEETGVIMEIALSNSLTFYDAAYLYAARREGLVLVTEDEPLRKAAEMCGCLVERVSEIKTESD